MITLRGRTYPHGRGSIFCNLEHVKGTGRFIEKEGVHHVYTGWFRHGKKHGVGRAVYDNPDLLYYGLWYNDEPRGRGIVFQDDVLYVGDVFDSMFQGTGTMYYFDEPAIDFENLCYVIYEGSWYAGIKHGPGKRVCIKEKSYYKYIECETEQRHRDQDDSKPQNNIYDDKQSLD